MKILKLILVFLVLLTACNKEDNVNNIDVESDIKNAALEERILDVNTVVGATKINSSTVKTIKASEIPETTDAIKIIVPKEEQTAFQKKGLQIKVGGSQRFDGVYLRAKDDKGNLSDDVLKIELQNNNVFLKSNSNKNNKKRSFSNIISNKTSSSLLEDEFEQTIDINFEGLEPGKFCYTICVFVENANGNEGEWVSQPEDVCVEVEAWGGNADIAGDWNFIKFKDEFLRTDCETDCLEVYEWVNNTELESQVYCNNSNNYVTSKAVNNFKTFRFNNDGTFFMELVLHSDEYLCTDRLGSYIQNTKFFGNWAYDEESNELTIVLFKEETDFEDSSIYEADELKDGVLFVKKAPIKLNGSNLNIKLLDDYGDNFTTTVFLER